jgi:hypothetical protein
MSLAENVEMLPQPLGGNYEVARFNALRCCRNRCWNLFGAASGYTRILDQAARSIGLSASFWVRVCHPSTLRMVI